jgi:hypothetical protein
LLFLVLLQFLPLLLASVHCLLSLFLCLRLFLLHLLQFLPVFLTFSARTSANQTQDVIDSKMEKKRKVCAHPLKDLSC